MKNKIILSVLVLFFTFCFIVLYKGLNNSNIYVPETKIEKTLIKFNSTDLYSGNKISSDQIFVGSEYYVLNIWASWCVPCREEHPKLIKLSENKCYGTSRKDRSIRIKHIERFNFQLRQTTGWSASNSRFTGARAHLCPTQS